MRKRKSYLLVAVLGLGMAISSTASTFNAVSDFSSANPSGAWGYGMGVTGKSFTPDTVFTGAQCDGASGLSCWQPANTSIGTPVVGLNTTASTLDFLTVVLPNDVLLVHPGPSVDSIVRWTAPSTGTYIVSGLFELLDVRPTGVVASIFDDSGQVYTGTLTGPAATFPESVGGTESFGLIETVAAGTVLSFGVNNDGDFFNDSTGFNATITEVSPDAPEPVSFGLFLSGIILMSFFVRRAKTA